MDPEELRRNSKGVRGKNVLQGDRLGCYTPIGMMLSQESEAVSAHLTCMRLAVGAQVLGVHVNDLVDPCHYSTIKLHGRGDKQAGRDVPASENYCCHAIGSRSAQPISHAASTPLPALPFPKSAVVKERRHRGFRKDYRLGDTLRAPSHMSAQPTHGRAFQAVSSLKVHDFAFVKRFDGSFSYAILAYRSMEQIQKGNTKSIAECMIFVTNERGSTKKVSIKRWVDVVRLVSLDGLSPNKCHPVRMISFDSQTDDECSMISNVSVT